MAELLVAYMVP